MNVLVRFIEMVRARPFLSRFQGLKFRLGRDFVFVPHSAFGFHHMLY